MARGCSDPPFRGGGPAPIRLLRAGLPMPEGPPCLCFPARPRPVERPHSPRVLRALRYLPCVGPPHPTRPAGVSPGPARDGEPCQHLLPARSPVNGLGRPLGTPCAHAARPGATARGTVFPLSGRRVDDAEQLVTGDGLGVQVHRHRLPLQVLVGLVQGLEDLGRVRLTQDRAGRRPPCG